MAPGDTTVDTGGEFGRDGEGSRFPLRTLAHFAQTRADRRPTGIRHQCHCWLYPGTAGRSRSFVVRDEGEALHLARNILKRRASAPRRIGVAYRVRELIDPEGWAGVLCDNPASEAKPRKAAQPPRGREGASIGERGGWARQDGCQAAKGPLRVP